MGDLSQTDSALLVKLDKPGDSASSCTKIEIQTILPHNREQWSLKGREPEETDVGIAPIAPACWDKAPQNRGIFQSRAANICYLWVPWLEVRGQKDDHQALLSHPRQKRMEEIMSDFYLF